MQFILSRFNYGRCTACVLALCAALVLTASCHSYVRGVMKDTQRAEEVESEPPLSGASTGGFTPVDANEQRNLLDGDRATGGKPSRQILPPGIPKWSYNDACSVCRLHGRDWLFIVYLAGVAVCMVVACVLLYAVLRIRTTLFEVDSPAPPRAQSKERVASYTTARKSKKRGDR